ncbi:MAG: hypothetical protein AB1583_11775 [Bacteroidota bacterium]
MKKIKKFIVSIALLLIGFVTPTNISAGPNDPPCVYMTIICPDGHHGGMAIVCSVADYKFWVNYFCGFTPE